jgi:hypothetical protein
MIISFSHLTCLEQTWILSQGEGWSCKLLEMPKCALWVLCCGSPVSVRWRGAHSPTSPVSPLDGSYIRT